MIRRPLEAGPVGEEELDMIKMLQEFCNRLYTLTTHEDHQQIGFFNEIANGVANIFGGAVNTVVNTGFVDTR